MTTTDLVMFELQEKHGLRIPSATVEHVLKTGSWPWRSKRPSLRTVHSRTTDLILEAAALITRAEEESGE